MAGVKVTKNYEGNYTVWRIGEDGYAKSADIIGFDDYFMGKVKRRYRVDVHGKTVASMIDTLAEAKTVARKYVK